MVNSMVEAGVLSKAAHQPALLGISKVENRTDTQFDTDELVKKIRVALLKGGRAQVTQQLTLGNAKEDPLGDQANQMKRFQDGTDRQPIELPDFTLSGKILFDRTKAGSTRYGHQPRGLGRREDDCEAGQPEPGRVLIQA